MNRKVTKDSLLLQLRVGSASQRKSAAVGLWCSSGHDVIAALARALDDASPGVRSAAAITLRRHASASAPALATLAKHLLDSGEDEWVREACASALGAIGSRTASRVLVAACADPSARIRERACDALAEIADVSALPTIRDLLHDPTWEVRWSATRALVAFHSPDAQETLRLAERDPQLPAEFRVEIAAMLRELSHAPAETVEED